jgi:hypothetical protein
MDFTDTPMDLTLRAPAEVWVHKVCADLSHRAVTKLDLQIYFHYIHQARNKSTAAIPRKPEWVPGSLGR